MVELLDLITSVTGVIGTVIIGFFPGRRSMRFTAFTLYVIANITLGILAYMKGIHATATREMIYLVCSLVGMYNDRPPFDR